MNELDKLFFELIRVAIGTQDMFTKQPSGEEWKQLYNIANKQSLVGICFAAVQKLKASGATGILHLPEMDYLRWMGMAARIQQRNEFVSEAVGKVKEHYDNEGYDMVLLKGQGNLCNYPESIRMLRTSGDIDAWIMPRGFADMSLDDRLKNDQIVLRHFWKQNPAIRHCYIHIHDSLIEGLDVEVHYRPSYINAPWKNRRFQRWMMEEAPKQLTNVTKLPGHGNVEVAVPTAEFNVVYQLSHLYRHIFDDGLGLRQVLDYYFALQTFKRECPQIDRELSVNTLVEKFGMKPFAQALMYVLQSHFGLEEKYLLCEPDSEAGVFLLEEIMMTGNFGHYDKRTKFSKHENGVQRLLRRQKRNMRFFGQYAEEVMSVPIYRIYQEWWRLKMNLICK